MPPPRITVDMVEVSEGSRWRSGIYVLPTIVQHLRRIQL